MAPILLILAVVLLPTTIGICLTYAAYQSYKRRRFLPPHDVERARNLECTRQNDERGIEMRDFERPERAFTQFQRSRLGSRLGRVFSARIAPVAKRLPSVGVGTIGREGLVSVLNGRGDVSNRKGKGRASFEDREFEQQALYAARGLDRWQRGELEQPGMNEQSAKVDLVAPKPMKAARTFTDVTVGRPAYTAFDAKDTRAADIWERNEKREYPKKSFDSIDLDHSREWDKVAPGNTLSSWATFSTAGEVDASNYEPSRQFLDTNKEQLAHTMSAMKDSQMNTAAKSDSYLDTVQQRYAAAKRKAAKVEEEKKAKVNKEEETEECEFAIASDDEESDASSEDENNSSDDSSSDDDNDDEGEENDSSVDDSSSDDGSDDSSDDDSDATSTHSLHASSRPVIEESPMRERANTFTSATTTLANIEEGHSFMHPGMSRSNTYAGDEHGNRQMNNDSTRQKRPDIGARTLSVSHVARSTTTKRQPLTRAQTFTENSDLGNTSRPPFRSNRKGDSRPSSSNEASDPFADSNNSSRVSMTSLPSTASKKSSRSGSATSTLERKQSMIKRLGRKSVGEGDAEDFHRVSLENLREQKRTSAGTGASIKGGRGR